MAGRNLRSAGRHAHLSSLESKAPTPASRSETLREVVSRGKSAAELSASHVIVVCLGRSGSLKRANSRMEHVFQDRADAGRQLAEKLDKYAGGEDVIVLGLPRGGVPVAYEVAKRLHVPLDVFIVRKLGVPGFEELAAGAIASGGVRVLNDDVLRAIPHSDAAIEAITARETNELERREQAYRDGRPPPELPDRVVILVDDGLATGATMRAAVKALRERGAAKIVVAVPVGPQDTCRELAEKADEAVCLSTPEFFQAVGQYYEDFSQTRDEDVRALLSEAARSAD